MLLNSSFLEDADTRYPCRSLQAKQLACFLAPTSPTLPAIVVHGLTATGKTSVLDLVLHSLETRHAVVKSQECITGRHLLERTVAACLDAIDRGSDQKHDRSTYARCENLSALTVQLQRILQGLKRFVLVFDRIDGQREAPPTLLPALARLNEFIPSLTVVLVVTWPRQRFLRRVGVPHIHFPAYTRAETLQIISRSPLAISSEPKDIHNNDQDAAAANASEDVDWLWTRFCAAIYDSQGRIAARDIVSMRALAEKLWPPFTASIAAGTHTTRDFSKLMVAKRSLFQSEEMLTERIVIVPPVASPDNASAAARGPRNAVPLDLPYYSKYLLCAAYLASFNPPRTDAAFFMQSSERKQRRRRRRLQWVPNQNQPNSSTHQAHASSAPAPTSASKARHRKIPRRLLTPSPFPLERLFAIFHALVPHNARMTVDVYAQVATLASLRMLVRAGGSGDVLDPTGARWRVNVGWEYVVALGRSVGLEVEEYVFEG